MLLAALALALAGGCRVPEDPDGTLDRVEGGTLRVGVSQSDPWVLVSGERPTGGVEVELIRRFARRHDARVRWVDGSEQQLVGALRESSLDVVIAGLTSKSRWKKDVAFTRPYVTTETVVAAPPGREPGDLAGVRVAAELGTESEGLLERKTDAEVVAVGSLAGVRGPVAAEDFLLDDLGVQPIGVRLAKEKHVMAVQMGENAFLVALERFLLNREAEIRRLVTEEGRP